MTTQERRLDNGSGRLPALDIFRGFAVLSLIVFNGFYGFSNAPRWITHTAWNGYQFADLIAPLFLFAVGMAMQLSLRKRLEKNGLKSTVGHVLLRGIILINFGIIGEILCFKSFNFYWGTLEMIGGCTIISAPIIIYLTPLKRVFTGFCIIFGWFALTALSDQLYAHIISFSMGGPGSIIAWSSIVIISSAIAGFNSDQKTRTNTEKICLFVALISGYIFMILNYANLPPNKNLVNSSYLSLSIALSCILFLIISQFQNLKILQTLLIPYGENALLMYMVSDSLNQILQMAVDMNTPLEILIPYSLLQILISSAIVFWLHLKKEIIKI